MKRLIPMLALLCIAAGEGEKELWTQAMGTWEIKGDIFSSTTTEPSFLMTSGPAKDFTMTGSIRLRRGSPKTNKAVAAIFFRWNLADNVGGYHVSFDFNEGSIILYGHTPNRIMSSHKIDLRKGVRFIVKIEGETATVAIGKRKILVAKLDGSDAADARAGLSANGARFDFKIDKLTINAEN